MKSFGMFVFATGVILVSADLFACPSGQTCPAGADCVSNSSLCVASSSSASTSSSGTSSEPTTVKDQLGLTFTPVASNPVLSPGASCTINCTFRPQTVGSKTATLTVTAPVHEDAQNASIPVPTK